MCLKIKIKNPQKFHSINPRQIYYVVIDGSLIQIKYGKHYDLFLNSCLLTL